jgi:hypothetical protein
VPDPFLDGLDVDTRAEKLRDMAVAEVLEADRREPGRETAPAKTGA